MDQGDFHQQSNSKTDENSQMTICENLHIYLKHCIMTPVTIMYKIVFLRETSIVSECGATLTYS